MEYSNSSLTLRYEAHGLPGCPTGAITFEEREIHPLASRYDLPGRQHFGLMDSGKSVFRGAERARPVRKEPLLSFPASNETSSAPQFPQR